MAKSLKSLPVEILDLIVSNFDSISSLSRLSQTCKTLYAYAESSGYRAFVRNRFICYHHDLPFKDALRSLTGLTRCWESRAMVARIIEPPKNANIIREPVPHNGQAETPSTQSRRQSIGYPAVLACKEEYHGGDWKTRRETLVIGAGAELRLRVRTMGPKVEQEFNQASLSDRRRLFDQFHHKTRWLLYRDEQHREGKCDITSVNIVSHDTDSSVKQVIYARACGAIERLNVDAGVHSRHTIAKVNGLIRWSDVAPHGDKIVMAGRQHSVSLYGYGKEDEENPASLTGLRFDHEVRSGVIWAGKFLDKHHIALGRDSKLQPVAMYQVRPEGLEQTPSWTVPASHNLTGVKVLCPIPQYSAAGENRHCNLLLTAWKSGAIFLHDIRSPQHHVAEFDDNIDNSNRFYSLLPYGTERFLAGANKHGAIRVFDLRRPGTRFYSALGIPHSNSKPNSPGHASSGTHRESTNGHTSARLAQLFPRYDFTLFLRKSRNTYFNDRSRHNVPSRVAGNSSVYSLAASSPLAPTFYAGTEGSTVQIDLVSADDPFPDVAFEASKPSTPPGHRTAAEIEQWLDPQKEQILLGRIETEHKNKLFVQKDLGPWSAF